MTTRKPYIFISHSTRDIEFTAFLDKHLRDAGFTTWVDIESIPEGSTWPREIQKGVEECGAMVVVMSKNGRESEWVERETLLAMDLRKPLFIALFEDMPLPIHLINRQYTDFSKRPDQAAKRLVAALQKISLTEPLPEPKRPREQAKLSPEPNEHNFFKYLEQLPDGELNARIARRLYQDVGACVDEIQFSGWATPCFHAKVRLKNGDVTVFSVWAYSRQPSLEVPLQYLQNYPPYDERQLRLSTLDALNRLLPAAEQFPDDKADLRPNLPLSRAFASAGAIDHFTQLVVEIVGNLRSG
jgi:hypothetical protein